ncbi:MAG: hypothetical protein K9L17_06690 [Clostridiales bacterium]|nr:hypothetical protein [Clostridiales bacterium]
MVRLNVDGMEQAETTATGGYPRETHHKCTSGNGSVGSNGKRYMLKE